MTSLSLTYLLKALSPKTLEVRASTCELGEEGTIQCNAEINVVIISPIFQIRQSPEGLTDSQDISQQEGGQAGPGNQGPWLHTPAQLTTPQCFVLAPQFHDPERPQMITAFPPCPSGQCKAAPGLFCASPQSSKVTRAAWSVHSSFSWLLRG